MNSRIILSIALHQLGIVAHDGAFLDERLVLGRDGFLELYRWGRVVLLLLQVDVAVVAFIIVHVLAQKLIFDVVAFEVVVDYMLMAGGVRGLTVEREFLVAADAHGTVEFLGQTAKGTKERKSN